MQLKHLYLLSFLLFSILCILSFYIQYNVIPEYYSDTNISVFIYVDDDDDSSKYFLKIINGIVLFKNIQDIFVIYTDKQPNFFHKKIKYRKCMNKEYNSFSRFFYLSETENECILFLSPYILPSERLMKKIVSKYDNDDKNYYGIIERSCSSKGYSNSPIYNNIILTNMLLSSKTILLKVFDEMKKDTLNLKKKGMEDILFQFYFEKIFDKKPIYIKGNYQNFFPKKLFMKDFKLKNEYCKNLYNTLK